MNEAIPTVPPAHIEIKLSEKDIARFWSKVDKNGPTQPHMETPCWVWTAAKKESGYGAFGVLRKTLKTHRIAWTLIKGSIAQNLFVCHHCDNPACVNVDHLFLGTNTDNVRDMVAKGRHFSVTKPERIARGDRHSSRTKPERVARGDRNGARLHPERMARGDKNGSRLHPERLVRGETHHQSRLNNSKVIDIRTLHAAGGISMTALAARFGMSICTISEIIRRKTWRHIP